MQEQAVKQMFDLMQTRIFAGKACTAGLISGGLKTPQTCLTDTACNQSHAMTTKGKRYDYTQ